LSRYYSPCVSDVKYSSFTMITSMLSTSIYCNTQPNKKQRLAQGEPSPSTFHIKKGRA
jgi:hypothetical protein